MDSWLLRILAPTLPFRLKAFPTNEIFLVASQSTARGLDSVVADPVGPLLARNADACWRYVVLVAIARLEKLVFSRPGIIIFRSALLL
jgi:hypothetical protein